MTVKQQLTEIRTIQMRTTAALMARDFPLLGVEETNRPGIIEFVVLVGEDRQVDAQDVMRLCGDGFNIDDSLKVSLGKYERSLQRLRKLIAVFKEETQNGQGERQFQTRGRRTEGRAV